MRIARTGPTTGLATLLFLVGVGAVEAAGALAVGNCGAYGFSYGYPTMAGAVDRALSECRGANCRIVARFTNLCAAYAIDERNRCGAWGWASRGRRAQAQRVAVAQCIVHGGRACIVRAWTCDGLR